MSVKDKLTSLADGFRKEYMLTDKLGIPEMAGLIDDSQAMVWSTIPNNIFQENMQVIQSSSYTTIKAKDNFSRITIGVNNPPINHLVGVYIVASCDQSNGTTVKIGPSEGNTLSVKVDGSMRGYIGTFNYNKAQNLSIMINNQKGAAINLKETRMWIID